ncbi:MULTISPECIES: MBL fold metallo-hydrolase [unclassified Massilia]|uniref:MBL fold metallo-hydrolase n=1 Tax=unclassified Massilia TaxID=2609279 RepID=UPI00177D51A2|nr:MULTISPECIES: MBL fold metallo-hydrolase [unclassified Massilia]MBD8528403.1 MBL fold metallo-hydrolase [Massilia sp. CFBP 13647]MBD8671975.1 MBL fold metallo-hydrolase [Massilia sp. CFBP 13721]
MPLHISRILHAGYVFECEGTRIAFDTIFENPFSRNCHAFPPVRFDHDKIRRLRFDAVFISHFHDDHCSLESLDLLDRATPIHIYCLFKELFAMVRELGFINVHALAIDAPVRVGPLSVTPRIAMDPDVDSMFQVEAAGLKVLNVVDSWIDPDTLPALVAHGPWDLVLWPFQTMREIEVLSPSRAAPAPATLPGEWIEQLQALNPRYVVPSSCQFLQEDWSWYNHSFFPISYRQFAAEIGAALPEAHVLRLDPSVSVRLDRDGSTPAAPLDWVVPVGAQDVDYDYDPQAVPPPTGEIARRFPALSDEQAARVDAYCGGGLLDKYRAMELPEDSFFTQPRTWRLSVFDHEGAATQYHYRVHGDSIEPAAAGSLSWATEIPAAKLYAALALGESLTSMYMRINDMRFDDATEADLANSELVDDPLIRCLFNDAFGAYQAAQLRRLKDLE